MADPTATASSDIVAIGKVIGIKGMAHASNPAIADGASRDLAEGSPVFADDVVKTSLSSAIAIQFANGSHVDMGGNSTMVLDADVFDPALMADAGNEGAEGATQVEASEAAADVEAIQQALLAGVDPTELEATAAGPAAGGGAGDEGNDFVIIGRSNQQTTPETGFDTDAINPEFPPAGDPELFPPETTGATPPGVQNDEGATVEANGIVGGNVLSNDTFDSLPAIVIGVDGGTVGSSFQTPLGGTLEILEDGSYTYTPPDVVDHTNGRVFDTFTITVQDGEGDTSTQQLTIEVLDTAPEGNPDSTGVIEGNTVVSSGSVLDNDIPSEDQPLKTVPGVADGAYGTITMDDQGNYSYVANPGLTHTGGAPLQDVFTYILVDSDGSEATATLTINVFDTSPTAFNNEGEGPVEEGNQTSGNVLNNDVASSDTPLTVTSTGTGIPGTHGTLDMDALGNWTYTANDGLDHNNGNLTDSFVYTIEDADGSPASAVLSIVITDGGPSAVDDDGGSLEEGNQTSGNVLTNDADQGDDPIVVTSTADDQNPIQGAYGTLTMDAAGNWTYTADDGLDHSGGNLTDTFVYTIKDDDGSEASAVLSVLVTDGGPLAVSDGEGAIEEGTSIGGNVLTNDAHQGDDPIVVTSTADDQNPIQGAYGSLTMDAQGNWTYTANDGLDHSGGNLTDSFVYTIQDDDGSDASAVLSIEISDGGPSAVDDDGGALDEGTQTSGNVLTNDAHQGDDPIVVTSTGTGIQGAYGTLDMDAQGNWTYTANAGLVHTGGAPLADSFLYTIVDDDGSPASAVLNIQIDDTGPTAVDDANAAAEAGPAVAGNVITGAGQIGGADTLNSDTPINVTSITHNNNTYLAGEAFTTALGATMILNANGSYTYTPPAQGAIQEDGFETFTYTITDNDLSTSSADLVISLIDIPDVRRLDVEMVTNSNSNNQIACITFTSVANPANTFSSFIQTDAQGQQGQFLFDAGFEIDATEDYIFTVEWIAGPQIIITDLSVEGVTIVGKGNYKIGDGGGNSTKGLTAIISPDDSTLVQGPTTSDDGGTGADALAASAAGEVDMLFGNAGDDTLTGSAEADYLVGGAGNDIMTGGDGNDILSWDNAGDTVHGGAGDDVLILDGAGVTLDLGALDATNISNVEVINITGTGDVTHTSATNSKDDPTLNGSGKNKLVMSFQDIVEHTDSDNILSVVGDADNPDNPNDMSQDTVELHVSLGDTYSTAPSADGLATIYSFTTVGGDQGTLSIDNDLTVNIVNDGF